MRQLPPHKALDKLKKYNFNVADFIIPKNIEEALEFASKVGYPVVLKVVSTKIVHKSDVGGVVLDIYTPEILEKSYVDLKKRFKKAKIMVQKQIKGGVELYFGLKKDESFGAIMILGLGGVYVELLKDITARLCPITREEFFDMAEELRYSSILEGFRGKKVDLDSLATLAEGLSKMVQKEKFKEMDINPVKALEKGYSIIDARIVV